MRCVCLYICYGCALSRKTMHAPWVISAPPSSKQGLGSFVRAGSCHDFYLLMGYVCLASHKDPYQTERLREGLMSLLDAIARRQQGGGRPYRLW